MRPARALMPMFPFLLLPVLAGAQNVDQAKVPDPPPDTAVRKPSTAVERPLETPDRFEPTERISEDLSVAFPVDI